MTIHNCILKFSYTAKPFDCVTVLRLIEMGLTIVTFAEHNIVGGHSSAVVEVIADSSKVAKFRRVAIPDTNAHEVGSQKFLRNTYGIN